MIKKTKEYDKFIFREDNREKIDKNHVERLIESIKSRNLLDLRPIQVNKQMEILDGQHRLLAAKNLGLDIYYQIDDRLDVNDIILMNTSKNWSTRDFFNFYIKNHYPEYVKLEKFTKRNKLELHVALDIFIGRSREKHDDFKKGKFIFKEGCTEEVIETCWETINYIKKMKGSADGKFAITARFWKALIQLVNHEFFNKDLWNKNLERMIDKVTIRSSAKYYFDMLVNIHDWRNNEKIGV